MGFVKPQPLKNFQKVKFRHILYMTQIRAADFPSHYQQAGRSVKLTSNAPHVAYGFEARHRHIL